MYRANLGRKDKGGAIIAVILIHAALLFAFLNIAGKLDLIDAQSAMRVFDLDAVQPPPPPPPPRRPQQPKPRQKEGGSAPRNITSQATPVVAPKPVVQTPPIQPIAAAETPRQGTAPTQGASDVRGPGTGAGGAGNGSGSGAGGTGPGGGGEAGAVEPPHLITPVLRGRDFPREILDGWPGGAQVFLRLRINAAGYVSECIIDRGSGVTSIDSKICALVHERLRFRPALDRFGQPVAGWFGYRQTAPR